MSNRTDRTNGTGAGTSKAPRSWWKRLARLLPNCLDRLDFDQRIQFNAPPGPSFTGIKCDSPGCPARVRGRTDTRALVRSLTLRAETLGWQCVFFDGEGHHYCPGHVDPDRERLRRFK